MFLEQVAPRWGRITKAGSDAEQFATQQVEYLGKVADALIVFPYGVHGNVPTDALALLLAMQGNPDNRAAIAWTPKIRPTLVDGEVAFYHPPTGGTVIWKQNGNLEITTDADIIATCANLTANVSGDATVDSGGNIAVTAGGDITADATGDLTATSGGTASVTATTAISLTAPTITLNGAVSAPLGMAVTGVMTNNGKNIGDTHQHAQGVDSSGDIQQQINGVL